MASTPAPEATSPVRLTNRQVQHLLLGMIRNPEKTGVFSSEAERQQYIDELVEAIDPFAKDNLYNGADIVRMLTRPGRRGLLSNPAAFDAVLRLTECQLGVELDNQGGVMTALVRHDDPTTLPWVVYALSLKEREKNLLGFMQVRLKSVDLE